ncbi:MAG TPA: phenylpyruvate tautomerase MIF-related protein [Chthoniobacter sp.]|jgi:phenylpyruvate tautomerase PptA (4-oxalocrotonate tautomerase family)
MPLVKVETTVIPNQEKRDLVLTTLSKIAAETIGKPEQYMMVTMSPAAMLMSGKPGDAAFVEVRSIGGLNSNVTKALSQKICACLGESLQIPQDRIYLNFVEVEAVNWGWNGATFG